jgi:hypothetical protein
MKLGKMLSIGEVVEDSAAEDRPAEGKAAGSSVAEGTAAAEHAAQAVSGQASRAAVTADGWDVPAVAHADR